MGQHRVEIGHQPQPVPGAVSSPLHRAGRWPFLALVSVLLYPLPSAAQPYPAKSVRLIAPFPTGASQILAHLVADKLTENLGRPVVVDYRPGSGGNVGAEAAAKAPADGYTLVMLSSSHATSPSMYKTLKYDTLRDFATVSLVATVPNVMVVHPSLPARSLKQLAALAKAHPRKLSFGSGGVGSSNHLASEFFKSLADVQLVHVPYKGASVALNNILAGEVEMIVVTVLATIPFITAGRLRGLAVLAKERAATLPEVPTSAEAGMSTLLLTTWYGLAVPAGTKPDIVERLHGALAAGLHAPEVKLRLARVGIEPVVTTPAEFSVFLRSEVAQRARVIADAGIRLE